MGGSLVAVYQKLQRIDPGTSAALVRFAAQEAAVAIRELNGEQEPVLPGLSLQAAGRKLPGEQPEEAQ